LSYMAALQNQVLDAGGFPPTPETPPDPWDEQLFTLKDAFKPRKPLQYIIAGLFPESSLNLAFGAPGTFKSMVLGQAAICVSGGLSFLGRKVLPSPAMWIDLDNGKRRTHERFEALGRGVGVDESIPFYYLSMPNPWFNAGTSRDIDELTEMINQRVIKFIVIDNLGLICPDTDENSDQMILVMSNLRLLAELTGAAVVLIHHQRKSIGNNSRTGESLRGHSSIEAALDLPLLVEREEGTPIITFRSTKTRDVDVPPFGAEFRHDHKPGSDELKSALFVPLVVEDHSSPAAIERTIQAIVDEGRKLNQSELVNKAKSVLTASEKLIRNTIEKMIREKGIRTIKGPHNSKLHVPY